MILDPFFFQHNNNLPDKITVDPSALRAERHKKIDRFKGLEHKMQELKRTIKSTQSIIIEQIEQDHPEIRKQYKNKFENLSAEALSDIRSRIIKSKQLPSLKQYFNKKDELDLILLDAERALTQVEKIARLQSLSRIDASFYQFATPDIRRNLEQLISCEDSVL